jgi:hypothetical protein
MTPDNWKIIEASAGQGVPVLGEAECALLDKVQERLALTDKDFWRFLIVLGKILPAGGPGANLQNIIAKGL